MFISNHSFKVSNSLDPPEVESVTGDGSPIARVDRRAHPRYPTAPNEAFMGWWAGETIHKIDARILNLSQGGALIALHEMPGHEDVLVQLVKPVQTRWYAMKILRVKPTTSGMYEAGLAFQATSSAEQFKSLIRRLDAGAGSSAPGQWQHP